ncbi:MAG: HDIG domain-containing protein [Desulfatibacillaceae bacterium]|nr:HDIG domain-containing protein [Desulfatibacillaceae bacterium]
MPDCQGPGISRDNALLLLKTHVKNPRTVAHSLASEAVMRALARHFAQDEELWGMAGLLHDLDYELTESAPELHGAKAAQMLKEAGADAALGAVIASHNAEGLNLARTSLFEHCLTAAETITGLIVAAALVHPDKALASVKPKSVIKRMKAKDFARAVSRERIAECEKANLSIADFVAISLAAMQEIAPELGL